MACHLKSFLFYVMENHWLDLNFYYLLCKHVLNWHVTVNRRVVSWKVKYWLSLLLLPPPTMYVCIRLSPRYKPADKLKIMHIHKEELTSTLCMVFGFLYVVFYPCFVLLLDTCVAREKVVLSLCEYLSYERKSFYFCVSKAQEK